MKDLREMPFTLAVQWNTTKKRTTHSSKEVMSKMRANKWRFLFRARIILNCAHICVCVRRGRYFAQIRYSRIRCCLLLSALCWLPDSLSDLKDVCWRLIVIATKYLVIYLVTFDLFIFNIISKWIVVNPESHGEFRETAWRYPVKSYAELTLSQQNQQPRYTRK